MPCPRAQFHGDRFANCMLNGANLEGGRFADVTLERCEVRDANQASSVAFQST